VEDGSREENATKNRKNGKIVNKRAERRIFQAEAVVRGRKEKFSARALGQNLAWGYRYLSRTGYGAHRISPSYLRFYSDRTISGDRYL
jgi:hypothetical protein